MMRICRSAMTSPFPWGKWRLCLGAWVLLAACQAGSSPADGDLDGEPDTDTGEWADVVEYSGDGAGDCTEGGEAELPEQDEVLVCPEDWHLRDEQCVEDVPCQDECGQNAHCDLDEGRCACNDSYTLQWGYCIPCEGGDCQDACVDETPFADGPPCHQWSRTIGLREGDSRATGISLLADGAGSVYLLLYQPQQAVGEYALSVYKYNAGGQAVWKKAFDGMVDPSRGWVSTNCAMAFDGRGGLLLMGYGKTYAGDPDYTQEWDIVLATVDTDGNLTRQVRLGGAGADFGTGLATDSQGRMVITGTSQHPEGLAAGARPYDEGAASAVDGDEEEGSDPDVDLPPATPQPFVVELDADGVYQWSMVRENWYNLVASTDGQDNVHLAGAYLSGLDLGGGPLPEGDNGSVFLASFTSAGQHRHWAAVNRDLEQVTPFTTGLEANADGSVLLTASLYPSLTPMPQDGPCPCPGTQPGDAANRNSANRYLVTRLFAPDGVQQWRQCFALCPGDGPGETAGLHALSRFSGDGFFTAGTIAAGSMDVDGALLSSPCHQHTFAASFDLQGNRRFARVVSRGYHAPLASFTVDSQGDLYLMGIFYQHANFGGDDLLTSLGQALYLVKQTPAACAGETAR